MKFEIEAGLKPPSFEFEYAIDPRRRPQHCDRVRGGSDRSSARRAHPALTLIH